MVSGRKLAAGPRVIVASFSYAAMYGGRRLSELFSHLVKW